MPIQLMIFYRVLGVLFLGLSAATVWEKYRTVRGAKLLSGRIVDCRKANRTGRRSGGGYRYLVEICVDGKRMELETNDAFWLNHSRKKGKSLQVWYNPQRPMLERKSIGTELMALVMAVVAVGLLLFR